MQDRQLYQQAVHFIWGLDKRFAINKAVGWVYAVRNTEFKRPLLKIGGSKHPPQKRAHQLGSATGVPGKFDLIYWVHAANWAYVEHFVHIRLKEYHATGEFFDVPIGVAVDAMDEVAKQYPINMDLAYPKKKQADWGNKWLPQAFRHTVGPCPHCGKKNKVHMLAVPSVPKCGKCSKKLSG